MLSTYSKYRFSFSSSSCITVQFELNLFAAVEPGLILLIKGSFRDMYIGANFKKIRILLKAQMINVDS